MNPVQDEWRESSHREKDHMVEPGVLGSNTHTRGAKLLRFFAFISVSFGKELGLGGW